jgi:hypothetical protein
MTVGPARTASSPDSLGFEHASGLDELACKIVDATHTVLGAATAAMFLVERTRSLGRNG